MTPYMRWWCFCLCALGLADNWWGSSVPSHTERLPPNKPLRNEGDGFVAGGFAGSHWCWGDGCVPCSGGTQPGTVEVQSSEGSTKENMGELFREGYKLQP